MSVISPCMSQCEIDRRTTACKGCYRTMDEIRFWGNMSDNEKESILKELKIRKAGLAYKNGYLTFAELLEIERENRNKEEE
jgi:predicted Fe-S protein YdhL (DUF1289 family)